MKRIRVSRARNLTLAGAIGVLLVLALVAPSAAVNGLGRAAILAPQATATPAAATSYIYVGTVKLDYALPGVFTDSLPTPTPDPQKAPPDLGAIDLGLILARKGNEMTGRVDLDFTMVFTGTVGPAVTGTYDGTSLELTSEEIKEVIGDPTNKEVSRDVTRQFRLTGGSTAEHPDILTGQYRETIWGYGPQPMTVLGTFKLQQGIAKPFAVPHTYLPLLIRK